MWDLFQQMQINDLQQRSSDARFDARSALNAIAALEQKVDLLSLVCHAMFEELQRTSGFTEARLKEKMLEIDMRDGKRDGKLSSAALKTCPDCGQRITKLRANCFWCGAKLSPLA